MGGWVGGRVCGQGQVAVGSIRLECVCVYACGVGVRVCVVRVPVGASMGLWVYGRACLLAVAEVACDGGGRSTPKHDNRLHRLVVRTSRCGRDNPGSTPGVDMFAWCGAKL